MKQHINQCLAMGNEQPGEIAQQLQDKNVVSFLVTENGVIIEEACDHFYAVELTFAEFRALLKELESLCPVLTP